MRNPSRSGPASAKRGLGLPLPVWLAFAGILLIIAGLVFATQIGKESTFTPEVTGSPRLEVDKELADLGKVPLGKWVEVSFDLRNVGDRPLRFLEKPSIELVEGC